MKPGVVVCVQHGISPQEHMAAMSEGVGGGYLTNTSSPPTSGTVAPLGEMDSPNMGGSNVGSGGGLATARVIRSEQKKFFFDLGSNARGQYLRISEVRSRVIVAVLFGQVDGVSACGFRPMSLHDGRVLMAGFCNAGTVCGWSRRD